ncbi:MAG TPA: DUF1385 domain-containing protein [Solirubrobacteraceae bacterium]|nr:DUF1385 domain-containing protein [Solirubrobacteraceae bacterium]
MFAVRAARAREHAAATPAPRASADRPVGGQAVLEGVMMRGVRTWAVAVRAPTDEQLEAGRREPPRGAIVVSSQSFDSALRRHRWLRLPLLRGVVALGGSLAIGMKALNISVGAQLGEGRGGERDELSGGAWAGALGLSLILGIGLFFVLPVGLVSLIRHQLHSATLFWLIEGIVRTLIFLGYLVLISRLRELRRVLEYHGAEHKAIACHEAGAPLEPARAQAFSRLHPRCGTSFLLIVMIVAIFVFAPLGLPAWYWLLATRILGVPVIAGISYEIIRLAARYREHGAVAAIIAPGLALQRLTTREPTLDQLEVAIAALRAVLDAEAGDDLQAGDLVGLEVVA